MYASTPNSVAKKLFQRSPSSNSPETASHTFSRQRLYMVAAAAVLLSSLLGSDNLSAMFGVAFVFLETCHSKIVAPTKSLGFEGSAAVVESNASSGTAESLQLQRNGNNEIENLPVYPYDRLRVVSSNPVAGINVKVREAYLSIEEFRQKFGMTKAAFYKLTRWKQKRLKLSLDLF